MKTFNAQTDGRPEKKLVKEKRRKLNILDEEESESGHQHVILRVVERNKTYIRARCITY